MRILVSSTAGLGHLLPLIPFAQALAQVGHEVRVATPLERAQLLALAGLSHVPTGAPTGADCDAALRTFAGNPGARAGLMFAQLNPLAAMPAIEACVAGWRPDVIVSEGAEFAGGLSTERHGIPYLRVHPGAVHGWMWEHLSAATLNGVRSEIGLPPDDEARRLADATQICTFPNEFEASSNPSAAIHRVRTRAWPQVTPVDERENMVYITFGTEVSGMPMFPELARQTVAAVHDAGLHPLISVHNADLTDLPGLTGATVERWVDQHAVLPQVRAVVCHGGAGTVLGALATATPIVVIPFFADQPFNAERVVATRVGARVDPGPELDVRLAGALQQVLNQPPSAGASMAAGIHALPGISSAVSLIEQAVD